MFLHRAFWLYKGSRLIVFAPYSSKLFLKRPQSESHFCFCLLIEGVKISNNWLAWRIIILSDPKDAHLQMTIYAYHLCNSYGAHGK